MTSRTLALGAAVVAVATACRESEPTTLHVATGTGADEHHAFTPRSALATYLELPGLRNELTFVLSEHESACDRFVPPPEGGVVVSLTLLLPPATVPSPGTYPATAPSSSREPVRSPRALVVVRVGGASHALQPGGSLRLEHAGIRVGDTISGVLAFAFPGDQTREATRVDGRFSATVCRSATAPEP